MSCVHVYVRPYALVCCFTNVHVLHRIYRHLVNIELHIFLGICHEPSYILQNPNLLTQFGNVPQQSGRDTSKRSFAKINKILTRIYSSLQHTTSTGATEFCFAFRIKPDQQLSRLSWQSTQTLLRQIQEKYHQTCGMSLPWRNLKFINLENSTELSS